MRSAQRYQNDEHKQTFENSDTLDKLDMISLSRQIKCTLASLHSIIKKIESNNNNFYVTKWRIVSKNVETKLIIHCF